MTTDLKEFIKANVTINEEKEIQVNLKKVQDGEWVLARKSEYKQDVYMIDDSKLYFEVVLNRSGAYHSGYSYGKPKFNFVERYMEKETNYPVVQGLKEKALELQKEYFDKDDDTKLTPVYESGWVYAEKVHTFESVYEVDGVLLKQTLYGNSDWTEFVEYDIVEKLEESNIKFRVPK